MKRKRNNYLGSLWLACKIMNQQNDSMSVEELYEFVLSQTTKLDCEQAHRYNCKIYRREHRKELKEYADNYRYKEKIKILKGED